MGEADTTPRTPVAACDRCKNIDWTATVSGAVCNVCGVCVKLTTRTPGLEIAPGHHWHRVGGVETLRADDRCELCAAAPREQEPG